MNNPRTMTLLLLTAGVVQLSVGQFETEFTSEGTEATDRGEFLTTGGEPTTSPPIDLRSTAETQQQEQTKDDGVTAVHTATVSTAIVSMATVSMATVSTATVSMATESSAANRSVSFVTTDRRNPEASSTSRGVKVDVTRKMTSPPTGKTSSPASPLLGNGTATGDNNATGRDKAPSSKAESQKKPLYTQKEIIIIVVVCVVGGLLVIVVVVCIIKNRLRIMRLIRSKDERGFALTPTQSPDGGQAPRTDPSPSEQAAVVEVAFQPSGSKGRVTAGGSRLQERSAHANAGYVPYKENESQRL